MTSTAAESAAREVHSLAFKERLVEIRRHLHQHPELSGEEVETTAYITSLLKQAGVKITDSGLKTGVIAEIGGQQGGPVIALRADIDALPIQEETGLPYASLYPGRMHACGHDFHTAALLGAVYQLKEQESALSGTVRFLFQPAEEKAKGAQQIIAAGGLDRVRAVIGMHNKPDLPVGTLGIKAGPLMAAADGFAVSIRGFGTHAAVPEAGIDPIVAASHIVTALQSIVSRNVGSLDSAVISVTQIHSGNSWNIIPDTAVLEGTIRSFDEALRRGGHGCGRCAWCRSQCALDRRSAAGHQRCAAGPAWRRDGGEAGLYLCAAGAVTGRGGFRLLSAGGSWIVRLHRHRRKPGMASSRVRSGRSSAACRCRILQRSGGTCT